MSDEATTKPTLDTLLERINALAEEMRGGFARIEHRLDDFDVRLDRIEGLANKTHSELMYLRADFKELKSQFKEPA
jgi:hypothetical protein